MRGYMERLIVSASLLISALFIPCAGAVNFESSGLGMSRSEFISVYGPEDMGCKIAKDTGGLYSCLKFGEIELPLMESKNVSDFHLVWKAPLTLDQSRSLAKKYIPNDSKLLESYRTASGSLVDVYMSESLTARFPAEDWDDESGVFIVIHSSAKKQTIIGINNNP